MRHNPASRFACSVGYRTSASLPDFFLIPPTASTFLGKGTVPGCVFVAQISYFNFQNNFYRLNKKAVDRLDGRMLLRLQDLRKEVNYVFFLGMFLVKKPFIDLIVVVNITEFAAV